MMTRTIAATLVSFAMLAAPAIHATTPAAELATELAAKIDNRPANEGRVGEMHFTMRTAAGKERSRSAVLVHSDKDGITKLAIHFYAPAAIQDTAFLSHKPDIGTEESWLYLPATDRVRRLPASERGDYFMGTDLTFGDIQDNFKFQLTDWSFTGGEPTMVDGKQLLTLKGVATDTARKELGYASFDALIDPETLFPVRLTYTDRDGAPIKTVDITDQAQIGDAWTAMSFRVRNLQTGHETKVELRKMHAVPDLKPSLLEPDSLDLGTPEIG